MVRDPVMSLTILKVKKGMLDPDKIFEDRTDLTALPVRAKGGLVGVLYVRDSHVTRPRWVRFFEPAVDVDEIPAKSCGSAAVLHVQRGKQAYLLTFGYGKSLIAPGVTDERFGLRVGLNAIDPNRIRSIDRKTFEAISRHTREQISRDSAIETFGLEVERDLLRAITGVPSDDSLGRRLTGMDALTTAVPISIANLGDLLDRYGDLSEHTDYRSRYPWVDNLAEVTDPVLQARLDKVTIAKIRADETDKIWLAVPDIVNWQDVGGFKYRSAKSAEIFDDLALEDYLEDCRDPTELSAAYLETDRVRCLDSSQENVTSSWSVKSCMCAEVAIKGVIYILNDARWFKVDADFVNDVDRAISRIPAMARRLPPFQSTNEGDYNRIVAAGDPALLLMDQALIPAGHGRGRVEFCDLFSQDGTIIHVKRYGKSSVLSHLFSQGVVSARLFSFDPAFRRELNERLPATHSLVDPDQPIRQANFEVAYAILGKPGQPIRLPFFSKVNLRTAAESITSWGFRISLALVS